MAFVDLLTHTCSIVRYATTTDLGHTVVDYATVAATTALVPCLIQPKVMREQATGAVIGTHKLYLAYGSAPSTLLAHGAEKTHRVTAWVHGGETDNGPFDIVEIRDAGGVAHHLEIMLKSTG